MKTGYAIDYLSKMFDTTDMASSIPRVCIIITNKASDDSVLQPAAYAKGNQSITFFAVGVGDNINVDELDDIASFPEAKFRLTVPNFDALHNIRNAITLACCKGKH